MTCEIIHILYPRTVFQVAKNRYTGDLGVMALEFNKASLSYGHKKKIKENERHEGINS